MKYYIFKRKKSMIGNTVLNLKPEKCKFEKDDIVFIANDENIIHTRWVVVGKNDKLVQLKKKPESSISLKYDNLINNTQWENLYRLGQDEFEKIEKYFIHNINIHPFYDYKSSNSDENDIVVERLKNKDYNMEIFLDINLHNNNLFEKYNLIISKNIGIVVFKCLDKDIFTDKETFLKFKEELLYDPIKDVLLASKLLSDDGVYLNINYQKFYIFETKMPKEEINKYNIMLRNNNILLSNNEEFCNKIDLMIEEAKIEQNNELYNLTEVKRFGILQMLLPQYVNSKNENMTTSKIQFLPEQTYELDENQKDVLAKMNKRTYLKAAAGSGKTILLLAKAYEVAYSNPDKDFLIICFNAKLSEDINIQATNTGKIISNLEIITFDKFIYKYYSNYSSNSENVFETRRKIFIEKVISGDIDKKYGGIFIDEMQQLNEEYISALLEILDDNKYMILAGDYFQKISSIVDVDYYDDEIDEDTSNIFSIGNYDFQRITLERNYRNTEEITKIANKMVKSIGNYIDELNIPFKFEERNIVLGRSNRKSDIKPRYFNIRDKDEGIKKICDILEILLFQKKYNMNDILLLTPWGNNDDYKKKLIQSLEKKLREAKIPYCDFSNNSLKDDGIRIGTIGRAIGLDFKAVIIFGTNMFNIKAQCLSDLRKISQYDKKKFISYLKNIYVACSRARDALFVIDNISNKKKDYLISKFLKIVGETNE